MSAAILSAISIIVSNILTILRDNRRQLIIYAFVSIITTIVSIILIRSNGILGASIAYCLSQVVCLLLFIILYIFDIRRLYKGERI